MSRGTAAYPRNTEMRRRYEKLNHSCVISNIEVDTHSSSNMKLNVITNVIILWERSTRLGSAIYSHWYSLESLDRVSVCKTCSLCDI